MIPIFDHAHVVRPDEIDAHGHVNNVCYVHWMQTAALAHSAAVGWPVERYQATKLGWVARRHTIEYLQSAFVGESIIVRTWVADFRKITSLRKYRMLRVTDGALLATAETNWAFLNFATGQPARIPADLAASFVVTSDADVNDSDG